MYMKRVIHVCMYIFMCICVSVYIYIYLYHDYNISNQIIQRCTVNPNETNIHVIPMGLAGEMHPFFRPNFQKCVQYEKKLTRNYHKIIAFIPTGWANASKWNKKNSIRTKRITIHDDDDHDDVDQQKKGNKTTKTKTIRYIDVEVRLISYSEHSTYKELISFVQYLHPRKVIPTVYTNDNDYRNIELRFRHYIDNKRAKKRIF